MDQCVKGMLVSVVMEPFQVVLPSFCLPISKWVSGERDEYLNYKDMSSTNFLLNI